MNIGIIAPIPGDGTSLYRAMGPFSYIARETGVHLVTGPEWDWTNIMGLDVMFLQRPFSGEHLMVARTCKALGIPLWVDYDDLYSDFPDWLLPQKQNYGSPYATENMKQCLDIADIVTVSTEGLKMISPKAKVIPNALNTAIWPLRTGTRNHVITWRGSAGHAGDLDEVMFGLKLLATAFPEWPQHYFGVPHFKCVSIGTVHPFSDPFSWMENFCALAPAVHIVPLADCLFNRCKSNNAWLEATAAGAVVVAPDLPEWVRPGIINYSGPEDFYGMARSAIEMEDEKRESLVNQSREFIRTNLTLRAVNRQRLEILEGLKR